MLKNIRLHLDSDEQVQTDIEKRLAPVIGENRKANINAIQRYLPNLLNYTQDYEHHISLFVNRFAKLNIVDFSNGRVLYGFDPQSECQKQVAEFIQHPLNIRCDASEPLLKEDEDKGIDDISTLNRLSIHTQSSKLPSSVDVIVVMGLGLGYHLVELLHQVDVKHVIVYEPEVQYFNCSIACVDWKDILEIAKQKNTALYFQFGKDGRNCLSDLQELNSHYPFQNFYVFEHYHHPIFSSVISSFLNHTWVELISRGLQFDQGQRGADSYCPPWTSPVDFNEIKAPKNSLERFEKNLAAFAHYFPDIYKEFVEYTPLNWLPVEHNSAQINLLNKQYLRFWYGHDPKQDSMDNLRDFQEHPNRDGLVLGYSGEKLKRYIHYQYVKKTESILNELHEEIGELPQKIKSLIVFGIASGYQLETLMQQRDVEKIFVCEPNRDFFYASLYAIDWHTMLKRADEKKYRVYINIGDDGRNLFRDLLNQFYAIGPYVLSNTYFYQIYYNSSLNQAVAQLREQLQVVISMGEYFDHARYGIAHTLEAIKRGYPHLTEKSSNVLEFKDTEVPVFLIGNGPSLGYSLETIKECKDKAILITCGTALQVLHRNGIVPDFHAEIEQNRTTFDWAQRIGDLAFLKQINLISCNGIHPDTCDLYKNTFIAFKEGESSTVSTLKVLGEENFNALKFAFPTVTNFALNLFLKLGFKQVYLYGVDLGFVDTNNHHSKQSGYYDKGGKPLYDYSKKNSTSVVVPGNFRRSVFTKPEFKIAKLIMEQSIASTKVEVYNTSDGAKISGSLPLHIDDILLISNNQAKQSCLQRLTERVFLPIDAQDFHDKYEAQFSLKQLKTELKMFRKNIVYYQTQDDFEGLIEKQKQMLFASYSKGESLLFYYLYGTVNYTNVLLTRLGSSSLPPDRMREVKNQVLDLWLDTFDQIAQGGTDAAGDFDFCTSFGSFRLHQFLHRIAKQKSVLVITECQDFINAFRAAAGTTEIQVSFSDISEQNESEKADFVVVFGGEKRLNAKRIRDRLNKVVYQQGIYADFGILSSLETQNILKLNPRLSVMQGFGGFDINQQYFANLTCLNTVSTYASWLFFFMFCANKYDLFVPKLQFFQKEGKQTCELNEHDYMKVLFNECNYEFFSHIASAREPGRQDNVLDPLGNRGRPINYLPKIEDVTLAMVSTTDELENVMADNLPDITPELASMIAQLKNGKHHVC